MSNVVQWYNGCGVSGEVFVVVVVVVIVIIERSEGFVLFTSRRGHQYGGCIDVRVPPPH
jgi:hypothetical protein